VTDGLWGEAYRNLFAQRDADKPPEQIWEERRAAHWQRMRGVWLVWQSLVAEHERLGYNGRNPYANGGQE
jgi:hypothetical protein